MREIRGSNTMAALDRVAVLAALNLAHELQQMRGDAERRERELARPWRDAAPARRSVSQARRPDPTRARRMSRRRARFERIASTAESTPCFDRRTDFRISTAALYFASRPLPCRRRAQTFTLSLKDDPGMQRDRVCKSALSGKPEGRQTFPLDPRVQGRFARIVTAEDAFFSMTFSRDTRPQRNARAPARRRRAFPRPRGIAAADALAHRLLALPFAPASGYVAGYWAMDGEIALARPGSCACRAAARIACRCCTTTACCASRRGAAGERWSSNRYGIPEPDVAASALLPASAMALVVAAAGRRSTRAASASAWAAAGTIAASRSAATARRRRCWSAPRSPRSKSTPCRRNPGTCRSMRCAPKRTRISSIRCLRHEPPAAATG